MGAAGPFIACVSFVVFALVWSVPEALVTAELTCMFPEVRRTTAACSLVAMIAMVKVAGA